LALGNGDKPRASRRGKYFPEWVRAHGGPPTRGDRLSPNVFLRRHARVEIGDTKGPAPYSVVRRIIEWETGSPCHLISISSSHGRHAGSAVDEQVSKDSLAVFEASALAGVEGEITSAQTQWAGVSSFDPPVKGNQPARTTVSVTDARPQVIAPIHSKRGCCPRVAQ